MSKITLTSFTLLSLLFLGTSSANHAAQSKQNTADSQPARPSVDERGTGTFQKLIVETGSVTMDLDLNRLNGINSIAATSATLHFAAGSNSFFPILVFNDLLRGVTPGTIVRRCRDHISIAVDVDVGRVRAPPF